MATIVHTILFRARNADSERQLRTGLCKNPVAKKFLTNTLADYVSNKPFYFSDNNRSKLAENKTVETLHFSLFLTRPWQ